MAGPVTIGSPAWRQREAVDAARAIYENPVAGAPTSPASPDSALATITQALSNHGLEALADWAYDLWIDGYDLDYIMAELRNQPAFAERFPAIAQRQEAGLPPISPDEYVSMERAFDAYVHAAGLTDFIDRNDLYTRWIAGDTSPAEAKARIDAVHQAIMLEPAETRAEMTRLFGAAAGPAAIAYYLDPVNSLPKIQQQIRQASIGGAAIRSMYGLLNQDETLMLDQLGVDPGRAAEGFGNIVARQELASALPGEIGDTISRNEMLEAEFADNVVVQQRIERQRARRRATAEGGGQYRVGRTGVGGLGDSSQ